MKLERLSIVSLTLALAACSGSSPDGSFGDAGGGDATTASASTTAAPSSGAGGDASSGDGGRADGPGGAGGADPTAGGNDPATNATTTTASTSATTASASSAEASSSSGGGPLPNLQILTSSTSYFDGTERVYFCLNQQPDGDEVDYDDEIHVVNLGDADAGTYHVALSLYSRITEEVFLCPIDLDNTSGTPAAETDSWDGPLCCDFGEIAAGEYHLRVEVDVYDEVAESDEGDNVHESEEIYLD